ncbi:MAG: TIR domain-containing protein [Ignavibacteria bacterium]|nr:TIR domain-containing protein [Ignavibacteria bacterium]
MAHKCFISFKMEDKYYKDYIQNKLNIEIIDKSLDKAIDSKDPDYVMRKIREDYLSDSTVTIFLIGNYSAESSYGQDQTYIKRELQASLYDGEDNTRNGILGIVLPNMYDEIYKGTYECSHCGDSHNKVSINDTTTIKEYNYNYYLPTEKCAWAPEDRYCILVKWDDFIKSPNDYIEKAFDKRSDPIAKKVKVYP